MPCDRSLLSLEVYRTQCRIWLITSTTPRGSVYSFVRSHSKLKCCFGWITHLSKPFLLEIELNSLPDADDPTRESVTAGFYLNAFLDCEDEHKTNQFDPGVTHTKQSAA